MKPVTVTTQALDFVAVQDQVSTSRFDELCITLRAGEPRVLRYLSMSNNPHSPILFALVLLAGSALSGCCVPLPIQSVQNQSPVGPPAAVPRSGPNIDNTYAPPSGVGPASVPPPVARVPAFQYGPQVGNAQPTPQANPVAGGFGGDSVQPQAQGGFTGQTGTNIYQAQPPGYLSPQNQTYTGPANPSGQGFSQYSQGWPSGSAPQPHVPTLSASDIEVRATYIEQEDGRGSFESLFITGSVTNTGEAVAPAVQVWCRMQGFMVTHFDGLSQFGMPVNQRFDLAPKAYLDRHVDTFRNLRPGETRPISAVVKRSRGYLRGVPEEIRGIPQGWKPWDGKPTRVTYGVRF